MPPESEIARKTYSVPALARALDIIELLVRSREPRSATEISRELALPKSSVFGILQTLRDRDYVRKNGDRYGLTLKMLGLGSSAAASLDLRQHVGPVLRELAARIGITAHLAVLDAGEAVYIDKAEAPGAIRLTTYVGARAMLHSTSLGKALLAWLPQDEAERMLRLRGMPALTARTITSFAAFRAELARVRQAGYAVTDEENEPEVRAVAAPVRDHAGTVTAAVNVGGTVLQIRKKEIPALGARVMQAALEMSRRLGYGGGS